MRAGPGCQAELAASVGRPDRVFDPEAYFDAARPRGPPAETGGVLGAGLVTTLAGHGLPRPAGPPGADRPGRRCRGPVA